MEKLTNSIKAKLYDNISSSFIGSFVISWIILNHKYILIYFSNTKDLNDKLMKLDFYYFGFEFGFILPLFFALFYTLIFPLLDIKILKTSEGYKNKYKKVKTEALGKRIIDEDDKNHLVEEISRLNGVIKEKNELISYVETSSEEKVTQKEQEITKLNQEKGELNSKIESLIEQINNKVNENVTLNNEIEQITKERDELKNHIKENETLKNENEKFRKDISSFQERNEELSNINMELHNKVAKFDDLEEQLKFKDDLVHRYNSQLDTLSNLVKKYENENIRLNNIISTSGIDVKFNNDENLSENEINLLRLLGKYNYKDKGNNFEGFVDNVTNWSKQPRVIIEKIILKLIKNDYLMRSPGNLDYVSITNKGKDVIIKIINDEEGTYDK